MNSTNGNIDISGTITADGPDAEYGGSGSGGSIRLEANSISGSGSLGAHGGDNANRSAGAGGRIYLDGTNNHSLSIDVSAGSGDYNTGNGSVYKINE